MHIPLCFSISLDLIYFCFCGSTDQFVLHYLYFFRPYGTQADKNEIYGVCLTCHTTNEDVCYGIAKAMCGKPEKNPGCVPDYTYNSATKECDYCLA